RLPGTFAIRRAKPGGDHVSRFSQGAAGGLFQSAAGGPSAPQAGIASGGNGEAVRADRGGGRASSEEALDESRDRREDRQGIEQVQGRQTFYVDDRGRPLLLATQARGDQGRSGSGRNLRDPQQRASGGPVGGRRRAHLQKAGRCGTGVSYAQGAG